jgi:hypothetical protein
MSTTHFRWAVPLFVTAFVLSHNIELVIQPRPNAAGWGGVAYFEPPRSVGTPIDEVARMYTGLGLADKIAGRLRLDTDTSLDEAARELIRSRLARSQ